MSQTKTPAQRAAEVLREYAAMIEESEVYHSGPRKGRCDQKIEDEVAEYRALADAITAPCSGELRALSDAATPGQISLNPHNRLRVRTSMDHPMCDFSGPFHRETERGEGRDPEFMVALWNAYREGRLVEAGPTAEERKDA